MEGTEIAPDELGYTDASDKGQEVRAVRLSLHLIVKRHLPSDAEKWSHQQVIEGLNKITHLRLDRENIGQIDSLELLGSNVNNVYLQQNRITSIQNLECLPNLQFLTLAGNQISTVENLQHLNRLLFLDLSENSIGEIDIDEFPQSLIILNLEGNPCCDKPDYRGCIVQDLPNLKQLDGEQVSKLEKREVGFQISSEEEGDEEEVDEEAWLAAQESRSAGAKRAAGTSGATDGAAAVVAPAGSSLGAYKFKLPDIETRLQNLSNEMLLRSQDRLEDTLHTHRRHMMEMDNIRIKSTTGSSSKSGHKPPAPK